MRSPSNLMTVDHETPAPVSSGVCAANGAPGGFSTPPCAFSTQSSSASASQGGVGVTWAPDAACVRCTACAAPFTLIVRRHHCRACGQIFCAKCSGDRMIIPADVGVPFHKRNSPERVCHECHLRLLPLQPDLLAKASKAVQEGDFTAPTMVEWAGKFVSNSFKLEIKKACHNLRSFPSDAAVVRLIDNARGVAFLSVYKLSFITAIIGGSGLVVARDPQTRQWSAPCCIGCFGLSIGFQAGGELNTIMLILNTEEALQAFTGGAQIKLGANVSIAAGPIGRQVEANGMAGDGGMAGCFAYAVSRGVFAGVGLDGTLVFTRNSLNLNFYGRKVSAKALLSGEIEPPRAAEPLYQAIEEHSLGRSTGATNYLADMNQRGVM